MKAFIPAFLLGSACTICMLHMCGNTKSIDCLMKDVATKVEKAAQDMKKSCSSCCSDCNN